MIKRRFYRYTHSNRDDPSGSSSSSSDSEVEGEATDETEIEEEEDHEIQEEEGNIGPDVREKGEASSSSGYESEDSSVNEVNLDSSEMIFAGLPTSDDDTTAQNSRQNIIGSFSSGEGNTVLATAQQSPGKDKSDFDATDCVLKCKSVFKCKLCPRIVCLSEETLKAHLISKRHARSEKLLRDGRLKLMLNDDGQIEGEAHSDSPDTTTVCGQKSAKQKKKRKGPWKQWKRSRQETKLGKKPRPSKDKREKRRKNDS